MKIAILLINHKHGSDVKVCLNAEIAYQRLWEYVKEYWPKHIYNETIPTDHSVAIDRYFEYMGNVFPIGEYYEIDEMDVDCGNETPSPEEENQNMKRAFGNPLNGTWVCSENHFSINPLPLKERQNEFKWGIGAKELHYSYVGPLCPTCGKSLEYDEAE